MVVPTPLGGRLAHRHEDARLLSDASTILTESWDGIGRVVLAAAKSGFLERSQ